MSTCTQLSDFMPAVAQGRQRWTTDQQAHLQDCDDCAAEWRLVQLAATLGAGEREVVDASALTRTVLARVRTARAARPTRWRTAWLTGSVAAAVVALVLIPRLHPSRGARLGVTVASATRFELPVLDALSASQLQSVLDRLDDPDFDASADVEAPELDALDSTGLQMVLSTLEGT